MSQFEIEQMTFHMQKFRVEADREAGAVVKLFDGEAVPVEKSLELANLCDDRGLPADEYPTLAEELCEAGIMSDQTFIPSIISTEKVEGAAAKSGAKPSALPMWLGVSAGRIGRGTNGYPRRRRHDAASFVYKPKECREEEPEATISPASSPPSDHRDRRF